MAMRKFYLIVTDEGEPSRVEEISKLDDLKSRVKELYAQRDKLTSRQLFVVYGERWSVTNGPFPYLVPPHGDNTGTNIPLFESPSPGKTDSDGFLGKSEEGLDAEYAKVTKALMLPKPDKSAEEVAPDSPFDS